MLTFMSYEIEDFLNPEFGLMPNIDETFKIINSMKNNIEQLVKKNQDYMWFNLLKFTIKRR